EAVDRERPEIVHVATPGPLGLCGLLAGRLLDIPVVGSYHTELGPYTLVLTRDLVLSQAMEAWVDWFYRQCRLVLAPPPAVADALRARGYRNVDVWGRGGDGERVAPNRRDATLRAERLPGGAGLALWVGR